MDAKINHLQIIQGIINRVSNNSFLLKGWAVTLVAGLFALSAKDTNSSFVYIAFLPTFGFWFLDGFYLHIERQYKGLYDIVRLTAPDQIDFCLDRKHVKSRYSSWMGSIFSRTLILFYGGLLATVIISALIMF